MQLDLKKMPFSRHLSRHMVYEESDNLGAGWEKGLYLALASGAVFPLSADPQRGLKALLKLLPPGKILARFCAQPLPHPAANRHRRVILS